MRPCRFEIGTPERYAHLTEALADAKRGFEVTVSRMELDIQPDAVKEAAAVLNDEQYANEVS